MHELQKRCIELARSVFRLSIETGTAPPWLRRPGKAECGQLWETICEIYAALTDGLQLPDAMPPGERRALDGIVDLPEGIRCILEIDEVQHFNSFRARALSLYPAGMKLAFPRDEWIRASESKRRLEGGGFARPKPPLFDMENGRHRQRAFRDSLADLLPAVHGWAPTIRLGHFELEPWIFAEDAEERFRGEFAERFGLGSESRCARRSDRADEVHSDAREPFTNPLSGTHSTQPVTATDLGRGQIRIPAATKPLFPSARGMVDICLRGSEMSVGYNPRNGSDKSRSGVLMIGKPRLASLVGESEILAVQKRGSVFLLG
jgi:hypothetical protein